MNKVSFKIQGSWLWIKKHTNANFVFTAYKQICAQLWLEDAEFKILKGGSSVPIHPPNVLYSKSDQLLVECSN